MEPFLAARWTGVPDLGFQMQFITSLQPPFPPHFLRDQENVTMEEIVKLKSEQAVSILWDLNGIFAFRTAKLFF